MTLPLVWFACAMLWWAPHINAEIYTQMGAELPYPTAWIVRMSAYGLPLLFGLIYSLTTFLTVVRPTPRRTWTILSLGVVVALWLAVALGGLAIPFQKCGFNWPDLPWQTTNTPCCSIE
jgi:hypothetical protein